MESVQITQAPAEFIERAEALYEHSVGDTDILALGLLESALALCGLDEWDIEYRAEANRLKSLILERLFGPRAAKQSNLEEYRLRKLADRLKPKSEDCKKKLEAAKARRETLKAG